VYYDCVLHARDFHGHSTVSRRQNNAKPNIVNRVRVSFSAGVSCVGGGNDRTPIGGGGGGGGGSGAEPSANSACSKPEDELDKVPSHRNSGGGSSLGVVSIRRRTFVFGRLRSRVDAFFRIRRAANKAASLLRELSTRRIRVPPRRLSA